MQKKNQKDKKKTLVLLIVGRGNIPSLYTFLSQK